MGLVSSSHLASVTTQTDEVEVTEFADVPDEAFTALNPELSKF